MGQTTTSVPRKADINGLVEFINAPYKTGYISLATVTEGGSGYTSTPSQLLLAKVQELQQ